MTASLTSALNIATSSMQYSQIALGTISHNIANANTAGYSRQVVNAAAVSYNGYGAGVQLEGITRVTDIQLQAQLLGQQSDQSYADNMNTYYNSVSNIFNPSGTSSGLSDNINDLFSAVSQLSNTPNDSGLQRSVVNSAQLLTQNIQSASSSLTALTSQVNGQIDSDVNTINTALQRINDLNIQIAQQNITAANGSNANDLEDARDAQVATLATMFKLNISTAANGAVRVSTEDGRRLVDENGYVQFKRTAGATPSSPQGIGYQDVLNDGSLSPSVIQVNVSQLSSGEIPALFNIRDTVIPNMQAQLNNLTSTLLLGSINNSISQGSSFPPVNSLTSGSTGSLANTSTADILTGLGLSSSNTFNISVTDSQGNPIATTVGATPISLVPTLPDTVMSLQALANNINNSSVGNATLGGSLGVIATVGTDANSKPFITIAAANSTNRVVLGNANGNVLGALGMNTLFTGTDASNVAVKASIAADPSLLPSAQMRQTGTGADGGLSSLNADNMVALAQLATTPTTFAAAGSLPQSTVTAAGYADAMASNLAVQTADAKSKSDFAATVVTQLTDQMGSVSGVNLNEELSNMLVFQQGFQASAHIISVVSDLFDVLFAIRSS